MRFAVEKRGEHWLVQAVHIGDNLHWMQHQHIQNEMRQWIEQNCVGYASIGWQVYLSNEQDLTAFLLRWS